ncbi:MAG: type I restriction endonuclease subunit R, partial [Flavobacteriales bacterium]
MNTPSFKEDHISQIPALQLLQTLGYTYLSPAEVDTLRGGKTTNVLLEDVLRKQLKHINAEKQISSTRTTYISNANIENGIRALKELPMQEGYINASQHLYNLITLGKTFEQNFDGDKKSITLQYIDWHHLENNVFHVTEEFSVVRSSGKEHYRPDIVLFVNGIPLCIIECKRPDSKNAIRQAISQHLRNQQEGGIRNLYVYAQLLLSKATNAAAYATNGTPEKFWAQWREQEKSALNPTETYETKLAVLKNTSVKSSDQRMFSERFAYVERYFTELGNEPVEVTEQDRYLYSLCRPERLMDLIYNFTLYDDGTKKVARYQQFFAVKKTLRQIQSTEGGKRKGGVIWHTQGSGKSLTMVMLAQAIAMAPFIRNPKIVL